MREDLKHYELKSTPTPSDTAARVNSLCVSTPWICFRYFTLHHRSTQHHLFLVFPVRNGGLFWQRDKLIRWRWLYTDSRGFLCLFRVNWCFTVRGSTVLARSHLGRGADCGSQKTWPNYTGLVLGLHPVNETRRYKVTPSLIGWAQT